MIVGDKTLAARFSANAAEAAADACRRSAENWWGIRRCKSTLENAANQLRNATGSNDGLVDVESARLSGVDDVVILPADHGTLVWPDHGNPPAAWPTIRDRMGR